MGVERCVGCWLKKEGGRACEAEVTTECSVVTMAAGDTVRLDSAEWENSLEQALSAKELGYVYSATILENRNSTGVRGGSWFPGGLTVKSEQSREHSNHSTTLS